MDWTDAKLAELPRQHGFRLRGLEMTRLETFVDAAFAFALTLLVISVDSIPTSYSELIGALKGVPAFAASFAAIATMWMTHLSWSRRYGLDDSASVLITLALIFIVLVYVYPLKMVFSGFFFWMSGGLFPASFTVESYAELANLFIVYGVGFAAAITMIVLLYWRALHKREALGLDAYEIQQTKTTIVMYSIAGGTGIASALWAGLMPPKIGIYAGFIYFSLCFTMPYFGIRFGREGERILKSLSPPPKP